MVGIKWRGKKWKKCILCKRYKKISNYYKSKDGYWDSYCKKCTYKVGKEWKKKNRARWLHLKNKHTTRSRYGLSLEDIQKLYEKQKGLCAICKQKKELVIDHDHNTKKVREMLCRACNLMLGYAQENPKILKKGITYLGKHF